MPLVLGPAGTCPIELSCTDPNHRRPLVSTTTVQFNEITVIQTRDQEEGPVTIHGAWYVTAGDDVADPDTVIRVEHCVDEDGNDRSEQLAQAIAGALQTLDVTA